MARTSTTQEPPGRRRHLLLYGVGFVLLTNVLTILFVIVLRSAAHAPAPVMLERIPPAAKESPAPAAHARAETREVRVTSRPAGAVVTYEGQIQGTTPLSVALPAHVAGALEIAKDGYGARAVTVEPDQAEVHVRLTRDRRSARRDTPRTGQASDQTGGRQTRDEAGDQPGAGQGEDPAAPAPTRADPPAEQPEAGQGADPARAKPPAPAPARSGARRAPAQADPALSRENGARAGAAANPDS